MALITMTDAKADLRILDSDHDADLAMKVEAASEIVIDYIKRTEHGWTEETAPKLIKAAVILVLRNMFNEESPEVLTDGVKAMLHRYRDPALA